MTTPDSEPCSSRASRARGTDVCGAEVADVEVVDDEGAPAVRGGERLCRHLGDEREHPALDAVGGVEDIGTVIDLGDAGVDHADPDPVSERFHQRDPGRTVLRLG